MTEKKEKIKADPFNVALVIIMVLVFVIGGIIGYVFGMIPDEFPTETDITVRSHDRAIAEQLNGIATLLNEMDKKTKDYENLLDQMYQVLNRTELRTTIIYNAVLDENLDFEYPYDDIQFTFMNPNNTTFMFHFYNNHFDQGDFSPIFSVDNWTEIFDWTRAKHPDTFTQYQKNFMLLVSVNMAYYKETGTWLGD